jgi:hypothetical protein
VFCIRICMPGFVGFLSKWRYCLCLLVCYEQRFFFSIKFSDNFLQCPFCSYTTYT